MSTTVLLHASDISGGNNILFNLALKSNENTLYYSVVIVLSYVNTVVF